jgi:hypothetical protein
MTATFMALVLVGIRFLAFAEPVSSPESASISLGP